MIYFIQHPDGGPIKIGTSIRLSVRLKALIAEHKKHLIVLAVIPGSYADENALHRRFAAHRLNGEWFEPSTDLMELIAIEGRTWDGQNEAPCYVSTKLDSEVLRLARTVASYKEMTLADYLTESVMNVASQDWASIIEKEQVTKR